MKKASIVVTQPYTNNNLFDINNRILNRDNCLYHYYLLREEFRKNGIDLSTADINSPFDSDLVIYSDMPQKMPSLDQMEKSFLIINESELIKPKNWDLKKHKYFKKIFTWNDSFVDNKKYFKVNTFPVMWDNKFPEDVKKEKLCVIISGNKKVQAPNELYSERIKAIRWFEKNHPEDFDLYGIGWDVYTFSGKISRKLNRFKILKKAFALSYPSYRGKVEEKKKVLSKYKFSICYENASSIPGYITEKIFDCFISGCVPIYLGAPNISDYIPKNCFIDKRNFSDYETLYSYIKLMPDNDYQIYLKNIHTFLNSEKMYVFLPESFATTITSEIIS